MASTFSSLLFMRASLIHIGELCNKSYDTICYKSSKIISGYDENGMLKGDIGEGLRLV